MKKLHVLLAASAMLVASQANAASVAGFNSTVQAAYTGYAQDLAAAAWMNPSNSAESHSSGILPFGIQAALEVTALKIDPNAAQWQAVGYTDSSIPMPRVRLSAGIPFGLDVGYMNLSSKDLGIDLTGYEFRMAFGNYIPVPMLEANVRYHTSKLTLTDMEVKNTGYAVMVGANLPIVKPYIEFGTVKSTSSASGLLANLQQLNETNSTLALGAKVELALFVINLEKSTVGNKDLTTVKLGFEF
ncbi:MAG: hypothetical protein Q9N62_05115 [Ghiorsea sp.]|nr:hypothetical protein [Ghiorsea sp.]MDQ7057830.1 hypothetical protein [Ghiorsea sp.]